MFKSSRPALDRSSYLAEDTVAAISSALGGAVGLIRVSGPLAFDALEKLTGSKVARDCPPRALIRAKITRLDGVQLDDALVARFAAPNSHTGEDIVEFFIHGGAFLASQIMGCLHDCGIRQALPGEFSFRAVRNGKISVSQAQAAADLIHASNDGALSVALEKMSGTQNQLIESLAKDLKRIAVLGEIGIDFTDQDLEETSLARLKAEVDPVLSSLRQLRSSFERGSRLQDGVRLALIGLPNAGKSSFFNVLLGEDRSIVSDVPGTTRDVVRERLTLRGKSNTITLRIEDTAGLRPSSDAVEKIGIERSLGAARQADLILLVVDPRELDGENPALSSLWQSLVSYCQTGVTEKTLGVFSKADLVNEERLRAAERFCDRFKISKWFPVSSVTGFGIDQAIEQITSHCAHWVHREPGEILITRLDQVQAVSKAIEHLSRAKATPEIDLFASDLRHALLALGPLIGETPADELLAQLFSNFCIGK